jgi:hypothetical protein
LRYLMPSAVIASVGTPYAIASSTTRPRLSNREGKTCRSALQ